jgi:NAD(P)-dependent dehydrogenase (short-subunit alcohol dehydrogenase family)
MPVVLITGCSSGFGLLTALEFARHGDTVVATMRDPERGDELRERAASADLVVDIAPLDVTDARSVGSAVDGVIERHGRIDVLVNNAGVGMRGAIEDIGDAEAKAVFDSNFFGTLAVTRAVLPSMRAQGSGVIVNLSSIGGRIAAPFAGMYSATKYALEAVSESLHYELHPFGIRVHVIEPGGYGTRFDANRMRADESESPYVDLQSRWDKVYGNVPGRRADADPNEVAVAIYEAATQADHPLRRLVGADAELLGQLRNDLDDATFEHTIRTALDFWE